MSKSFEGTSVGGYESAASAIGESVDFDNLERAARKALERAEYIREDCELGAGCSIEVIHSERQAMGSTIEYFNLSCNDPNCPHRLEQP